MSDIDRFGLVREAPEFLIWTKRRDGGWQAEGGAPTRRQAERVAVRLLGKGKGLILPRGVRPDEQRHV